MIGRQFIHRLAKTAGMKSMTIRIDRIDGCRSLDKIETGLDSLV